MQLIDALQRCLLASQESVVTIGFCLLSVDNALGDFFWDYPCPQTVDHYSESSLGMSLRLNQPIISLDEVCARVGTGVFQWVI
jgi:hypothetical protein